MHECRCPLGVSGDTCDQVRFATFGGNNFVQVSTANDGGIRRKRAVGSVDGITMLTFSFQTTVEGGIIMFASGVSLLAIR